MKFDSYSDGGHGWVRVPRKLLIKIGIESKITPYSYQRGEWVYLEEDADVTLFWRTMHELGDKPEFRHHTTDKLSKIRGYESFKPTQGAT